jgi:hypothetical protein
MFPQTGLENVSLMSCLNGQSFGNELRIGISDTEAA